jgi:hypothetical protein
LLWALNLNGVISISDLISFSVTFIAGLLGIIFGFMLSSASERDRDKQTVATFLKLVHHELMEIREMPTNDTSRIYILYTDIWDSMVSSGILCLLKPLQVMRFSTLYKQIKGASFEAEWFRQVWEDYQDIPESEHDKKLCVGKKLDELGLAQLERLKMIQEKIDKLFIEDFWNEGHWTVK